MVSQMDLFEKFEAKITIPQCVIKPIKVGNNQIQRIINQPMTLQVVVQDSLISGLYELHSNQKPPFDLFYLKKWNSRTSIPANAYCLRYKTKTEIHDLNKDTELTWQQHPLLDHKISPSSIVSSWAGQFQFKQDFPEINQLGLRKPQLGALHAISAYFSSERNIDPATIVLPTGTGKTETMLSTLIYQQCKKVLVMVPSSSLREQIFEKVLTLGCLPELGVVPIKCNLPYVVKVKTGIRSPEEAHELTNNCNVIVATASILNSSDSDAINALCEQCSHLFVDEAHHISANSWSSIRDRFSEKRVVQFTATPFRNDKNSLGGKIIYNYTMGEAQKAGYFRTVNLCPVEEYFEENIDWAIAERAIAQLRQDLENDYDHLMMVRVKEKKRTQSLFEIYNNMASDFEPIVVHSDFTQTKNRECLAQLLSRQSRIVICVDMLGEGYDLPNLKIAAIHDHHKSLAVTLQFIGRFTRTSAKQNIHEASVIVNTADPEIESSLRNLYAQGADWDVVLRRLSENRIEREVELQDVVDDLKEHGDLHKQLSLWNLTPSYTSMLFSTKCSEWTPEHYIDVLPKCDEHWHAIAPERNILVVLAVQSSTVKWGAFKDLRDINYKILIAHWDNDRNALFIFSNDYKFFRTEKLAENLCGDNTEVMSGEKIFNVLNNIEYPLVKNLGSSQVGAISFTQFFGPNVTEGLSSIEKSQSSLSNLAALGYEEGNKVVWGCSQRKGKVWSPQKGGSIADWRDWVTSAWDKVVNGNVNDSNITRDFLRPQKIDINHPESPVSVQWGEMIQVVFEDSFFVIFGDEEIPLFQVDLSVRGGENHTVEILLSSDEYLSVYRLYIDNSLPVGYEYELIEGNPILFRRGNSDAQEFSEKMISDPIIVYYIDGSFSYNCYHINVSDNVGIFKQNELRSIDWSDVDIRKESMNYEREQDSIQFKTFSDIEDQYDVIINDDGCGEAADLVALKLTDEEIVLSLFHCKFSSGDTPGARLKDLYEVCGQAQRSIRWKHVGVPYLHKHIKKREEQWLKISHSRFLKGSIADLSNFKNRSRTMPVQFQVIIIQPGISSALITEEMLKLLGTTELFIKKTTQADLEVICSE